MYAVANDQNAVVMFCAAKRDQPDKPRLVTHCCLWNLDIYKKQSLLPNIDKLSRLVATYLVWSKMDLADGYFYIGVEESAERWNTIQTTHGKIRSCVILSGDCNAPCTMMKAILDICRDIVYQCPLMYIDHIIIYSRSYEKHIGDLKEV